MADKFISERNLKFLLYDVFDAVSLTRSAYYEDHSKETFDLVLEAAFRLAKEGFKPHFEIWDKNPPELIDGEVIVHPTVRSIMKACGEGGWISARLPNEAGGQQLPDMIALICRFIFASANYSASVYYALTEGSAHLMHSFASDELKELYLPNMLAGKWQGTMALTEPQAGSSLADIKTTAEPTECGYYKMKGQKIFISAGDHDGVDNVIHLLLARITGAPLGVKGISLFVVPKRRIKGNGLEYNDVNVAGLFHKLGYRGVPLTQLVLGESDDCRGFLVGEPNHGLKYMFQMMNGSRLAVGICAAAIASAAYYAALEYTQVRLQGRASSNLDFSSPQIPIIQHSDVKRMLMFQRSIVEGSLSLLIQCAKFADLSRVLDERGRQKYALLLDVLIPVCKSYPSEMGIISVSQSLQCLGGYGFCDEFPMEQYYRDIRIHAIHEGTTGIQGLDLLGRKIFMKEGKAFDFFLEEVKKTIRVAASYPEFKPQVDKLNNALRMLQEVTFHLRDIANQGKRELILADATLYLEFFGIICIAWQWLVQAVAAQKLLVERQPNETELNLYCGKLQSFRYFYEYELPKTCGLAMRLKVVDGLALEMKQNYFSD